VRLAILISLGVLGLGVREARADDALVKIEVGAHGGYLVPVAYAEAHRVDFVSTLPDGADVDGFWKVSEQIANVTDRNLREAIEDGIKDPTVLLPGLTPGADGTDSVEFQRTELKLILEHYNGYQRQYVGVVIEGRQYMLCNYVIGPHLDPSAGYLFINRIFEPGKMHFLQCRFDWDYKKISNIAMIGPWQGLGDR
jgi:hypothetical protein